jgi:hypothetical protein
MGDFRKGGRGSFYLLIEAERVTYLPGGWQQPFLALLPPSLPCHFYLSSLRGTSTALNIWDLSSTAAILLYLAEELPIKFPIMLFNQHYY